MRLRREALVGASMSHPNLVSIYDVIDSEDGNAVIVMEYVQGVLSRHRFGSRPHADHYGGHHLLPLRGARTAQGRSRDARNRHLRLGGRGVRGALGRRARREPNALAVAHAIATQPSPDLREFWPEAPAAAAEVLIHGMCRALPGAKRQRTPGVTLNRRITATAAI
jgi:hypothetical protein